MRMAVVPESMFNLVMSDISARELKGVRHTQRSYGSGRRAFTVTADVTKERLDEVAEKYSATETRDDHFKDSHIEVLSIECHAPLEEELYQSYVGQICFWSGLDEVVK